MALLAGFSFYAYLDCHRLVQKESAQLAARIEKVFLLEVESTLEEMMVFGKEQLKNPHVKNALSDKSLFFYPSSGVTEQPLFDSIPHLGRPVVDQGSGLWVIPASLSILNLNHREIGEIVKFINMRKLTEFLRKNTYQIGKIFAVLDPRFGAIFQSENNPGDHKSLIYPRVLQHVKGQDKGWMDLVWPEHDVRFLSFLQIPKYPYLIVTGVQSSYFSALVMSRILLIVPYGVIAFLLCAMGLLVFSDRKQASLSQYQKLFRQYLLQFCVETVVDTLKVCRVSAGKIKAFDSHNLTPLPEKIALNALIEECLFILEPDFISKGVQLKTKLSAKSPKITLPIFDFQKIFLNLVRNSLESCGKKGLIKISTLAADDKMLLMIEDSAFHLSLENRLEFSTLRNDTFSELGFKAVMQLIQEMNAELFITMKEPKGNVMTLKIPYNCAKVVVPAAPNNVIHFKT